MPERVVETTVTCTQDLVTEAIETYRADRVIVIAVREHDHVQVHALAVACTADHHDLIDPVTAGVLHESAAYWGATEPAPCLCTTLALLGDDWRTKWAFLTGAVRP
ncbi:MAG: hypothetical protein HOZ81_22925 [Streptomyces sp.]|nr:hypothetical protein [Streptomyces sp.]NUP41816.1 hypothetical protein [Streptomyces sp.]